LLLLKVYDINSGSTFPMLDLPFKMECITVYLSLLTRCFALHDKAPSSEWKILTSPYGFTSSLV